MNDENITNNSEEELSDNIITLTDEDGKESNFELLDLVELDNEEYVVLLPVDDEESEEPGEVVILKVEDSDDDSDEETESYVSVEDEETLTKVFEIFKEVSRNRCVILVTHDLNLAKEYATTLIYIEDGKVKFIKHNDKQEKKLLNQETEGTRNFDKSKGKSWEFGYSLSQFKKNIKKNVSVVVAITILLLCCGFIMGISASIHSMYTRINTNLSLIHI